MLSTIEALFSGRRELFEGLAVSDTDWEWVEYPVFHIDLNVQNYDRAEKLTERLLTTISIYEQKYGVHSDSKSSGIRFENLIRSVYEKTGKKVVILIDEYDKPLLKAIGNEGLMTEFRNELQGFYGVIKSLDLYIRFAMLTGVTRFGKLSVFSALNNLKDISLSPNYSTICGISQQELAENFRQGIYELAEKNDTSEDDIMRRLKKMYDGYHFSHELVDVYNPFRRFCRVFPRRRWTSTGLTRPRPHFLWSC